MIYNALQWFKTYRRCRAVMKMFPHIGIAHYSEIYGDCSLFRFDDLVPEDGQWIVEMRPGIPAIMSDSSFKKFLTVADVKMVELQPKWTGLVEAIHLHEGFGDDKLNRVECSGSGREYLNAIDVIGTGFLSCSIDNVDFTPRPKFPMVTGRLIFYGVTGREILGFTVTQKMIDNWIKN